MPATLEQRLAGAIPLSVYRALVRRPVTGLVYHAVSSEPLPHLRHLYPTKSPGAFTADLDHLQQRYNPVPYERVLSHVEGGQALPSKAVLLTFDDGYAECFSQVRPLLLERRFPAVFFLATDFIDNRRLFYRNKTSLCLEALAGLPEERLPTLTDALEMGPGVPDRTELAKRIKGLNQEDEPVIDRLCAMLGIDTAQFLEARRPYLTTDQVRMLAAEGFTIGAHSCRHIKFSRLDQPQIEEEIVHSCRVVQEITGAQQVPFAFPFSGYGVDRAALAALRRRHGHIGLLFDSRGLQPDRPFVLPRVWADPPSAAQGSNIDQLLHKAYKNHAVWRRQYWASLVRARLAGRANP